MSDEIARDFLLKGFPNPERKGCPDENTLLALAEGRLPELHPARMHLGSCSECYAEYLHYREDRQAFRRTDGVVARREPSHNESALRHRPVAQPRTRTRLLPLAVAASVLVLLAAGVVAYKVSHGARASNTQMAKNQPIQESVDLFGAGTLRGTQDGPTPLEQVSLPAAVLQLSVTLPRFSEPGPYTIVISQDRAGEDVIGQASSSGVDEQGKVKVRVLLDLRSAKPGAYFLATVRGSDNGTYYYPLRIQ